ncbi:phage tail protein [Marinomonas mediterranea]|jgi:Microcystin-dependent protein|uniref:Tail Collar domain protein n=1 Tax=Marinomonas mediterranea (strain ATCC 700492 / JCM 21426 / NBRC 103028 / MMB-1) TaxID=717774 RepID=F2JVJ1_MARM1|nr:tail fiber protein [Marinomonas mediterranea]ADZ90535.1 Tail Collar domain protein [Marinomonas mediterranea MMB-1]WCN16712.1 hypothetical protein GV053_06380 [Marinomonas mediterranea MMB-1]
MSDPFIGEIKMFGFDWPPVNWSKCEGQEMLISQNAALFSLIHTTYGGNGQTTYNLPDLRGRTPIGAGDYVEPSTGVATDYSMGSKGGQEFVTLTPLNMPSHTHDFYASNDPSTNPALINGMMGKATDHTGTDFDLYSNANNLVTMSDTSCSYEGGGQAHPNTQPSAVTVFCIALDGIYPSRN